MVLFCQVVFSQNNDIVKSFNLRIDKSAEKEFKSDNISKALTTHFNISENYEFKRQIIKGTKDRISEKDDLGYVHERYTQYYKGIKIEHSDIRIHYLNDLFVSANGEYIDAPNIDISIILSKEKAIEKAKEYIGAEKYAWENEAENNWIKSVTNGEIVSFYPNPEIVICKNSIDIKDTTFHVAYKIDIFAKEPLRRDYIFVDAKNGRVLAVNPILVNLTGTAATRYSGTKNISTQQNGNTYRLRGYDNNRSIETYNMNKGTSYSAATDFTDNDNNWTATEFHNANKDDAALEAHWGAMVTWDYFKSIHGRNSFDNNGSPVKCYVHYGVNYANASWSGVITMGDGNGTTIDTYVTLDVIAHEFGHGVCQYSADLVYSGESGALNEGLSDIWGACVSNYANNLFPGLNKNIWLHRIDAGTANRSLMNPNSYGQPDTYGGGAYWTGSNAGVHTNSGIMNHWFYILSVGKSGTNGIGNTYNVAGIGIEKAAKIVYRAETVYMTPGTTFADARVHTIQAAVELYGECSSEVLSVTDAWHAVGVGNKYSSTLTITQNTTWNTPKVVTGTVVISSGVTLTVTSVVECAPNVSIIVKPGGSLVVNGGTLTNACSGGMWQGIILENATLSSGGAVTLNNAIIENAVEGINTSQSFRGGLGSISAFNSTFRNNGTAVKISGPFDPFGAQSCQATFYKSHFIMDNNNVLSANRLSFSEHIYLSQVSNVVFWGCNFQNTSTSFNYSKGINAHNSGFTVDKTCESYLSDGGCLNPTHSYFNGFEQAIVVNTTGTQSNVLIDNSKFSNNSNAAIAINGMNNVTITRSDFEVNHGQVTYGIKLKNATGYTIEGNYFYKGAAIAPNSYPYLGGIEVHSSGINENIIRRNQFINLTYPIDIYGINGSTNASSPGLQFMCNEFNKGMINIYCNSGSTIRRTQGSPLVGADNDFINTQSVDIIASHPFTYYYSNQSYHYPSFSGSQVTRQTAFSNSCLSYLDNQYDTIGGFIIFLSPKSSLLDQYDQLSKKMAEQKISHKNMTNSNKSSILTNSQKAEMAAIESSISELSLQMNEISRQAIKMILQDTNGVDLSLLTEWYSRMPTASADYSLVETYYHQGKYSSADNALVSMLKEYDFDDIQLVDYDNYSRFHALKNTLQTSERYWDALTEMEIDELKSIAEASDERSSTMAKGVLCFFYDICYEDKIVEKSDDGILPLPKSAPMESTTPATSDIQVFPNPVEDNLTVSIPVLPKGTVTFQLVDVNGRITLSQALTSDYSTINLSNLPNGTYYYQILHNGVSLKSDKVVKQ